MAKREKSEEKEKENSLTDKLKDFYNSYATKKTISNGLMDGAVLATNAAQLRFLLREQADFKDTLWVISLTLVAVSIVAQLIMAIFLGLLARNNLADMRQKRVNNIMNNIVLILTVVVFVTNIITNVFIQVDITDYINNSTAKTTTAPGVKKFS